MRFEQVRERIQARVSEQMIGTQASVSMVDLRTIRVFVVGEVEQPGSYTVGGLAAISNALLASGGIKPIGSLRNIQLKRNGALIKRLDLYDLLLNGDASNDARLQTGDVILVPPVGVTVGVSGEVKRPAIYELKGEGTAVSHPTPIRPARVSSASTIAESESWSTWTWRARRVRRCVCGPAICCAWSASRQPTPTRSRSAVTCCGHPSFSIERVFG
jgi:hypothetical protein